METLIILMDECVGLVLKLLCTMSGTEAKLPQHFADLNKADQDHRHLLKGMNLPVYGI